MLDMAARAAVRGSGRVEPNPLVGCVIARERRVLAIGHHRAFGGLHAEAEALAEAARRGVDVRGASMYVTLEPCNIAGRNPACVDGVIAAGIGEVICARPDPSPGKGGGAARLRAAGIDVRFTEASANAIALAEPWLKRLCTDQPWVIAKWAQSIDGRMVTSGGESQWLTGPRSRLEVQRLRSTVDAIITGTGTVLADNPRLDVREVPARRRPLPVILSRQGVAMVGGLPRDSHMRINSRTLVLNPDEPGIGGLRGVLAMLRREHSCHSVLIEAGPTLLSSFLAGDAAGPLVDELHVFTAPLLLGGSGGPVAQGVGGRLAEVPRWRVRSIRQRGVDVRAVYRRAMDPGG